MALSERYRFAHASGESTMRALTLKLPADCVREFLPPGLELDPSTITTSDGTYPVIVLFEDMRCVQITAALPGMNLIPGLDYHEHSVNIPNTYISAGVVGPGRQGPYNYMAKLYLDHIAPTATGLLFWGLAKELGLIQVSDWRYSVSSLTGWPITSFTWDTTRIEVPQRIIQNPTIPMPPALQFLLDSFSLTIVSRLPLGLGSIFVLADCDRVWTNAEYTTLYAAVEVHSEYLPGYQRGRYPASAVWSGGDPANPPGFKITGAMFRLSLPYLPLSSPSLWF